MSRLKGLQQSVITSSLTGRQKRRKSTSTVVFNSTSTNCSLLDLISCSQQTTSQGT